MNRERFLNKTRLRKGSDLKDTDWEQIMKYTGMGLGVAAAGTATALTGGAATPSLIGTSSLLAKEIANDSTEDEETSNQISGAINSVQTMLPTISKGLTFKYGGKMSKYNFGGQMQQNPMNEISEINGASHEQGGIQVPNKGAEVEDGETIYNPENYVFSASLFPDEKLLKDLGFTNSESKKYANKSFSYISKVIKKKIDNLRDNDDSLTKQTIDRYMSKLIEGQESLKNSNNVQNNLENFRTGGFMVQDPPVKKLRFDLNQTDLQGSGSTENPMYNLNQYNLDGSGLNTNEDLSNQSDMYYNFTPDQPVTPINKNEEESIEDLNSKVNPYPYIASGITNIGKSILNLTQRNPAMARNLNLKRINTRPSEVLAEKQYDNALASYMRNLKDNAPSAGSYISNLSNIASDLSEKSAMTTAGIRQQGDLKNIEIANQEEITNQGINYQNQQTLEQFEDTKLQNWETILNNLNQGTQQYISDSLDNKEQNRMIKMLLESGNFVWKEDGLYGKKSDGTFVKVYSNTKNSKKDNTEKTKKN